MMLQGLRLSESYVGPTLDDWMSATEVLIKGPLAEVVATIRRRRAELREQHGWIMDSYLLRRNDPGLTS